MDLLTITFTSFLVAFSGALVPGPLLAITIDHSLKKGFKAGPLIIAGHAILELLLILLIIVGFGDILKKRITLTFLSLAGGFLLVWMGLKMVKNAKKADIRGEINYTGDRSSILSGIVGSLSNPYWAIWWVTIGLTYIAFAFPYGFAGILLFFLGHISADFLWYGFVSFSLSKGRDRISPGIYKILVSSCGLFLILFGGWLMGRLIW